MPPSLFTELGLHTTRAESFVARGVLACGVLACGAAACACAAGCGVLACGTLRPVGRRIVSAETADLMQVLCVRRKLHLEAAKERV